MESGWCGRRRRCLDPPASPPLPSPPLDLPRTMRPTSRQPRSASLGSAAVHTLADMLWTIVRWTLPVAVAFVIAAAAVGTSQVDEHVRQRVAQRLAETFPTLAVSVDAAELDEGRGIVVRGVTLMAPELPGRSSRLARIDEIRLACGTSLAELASGPPAITGVHVRRVELHAVRLSDGRWNLARLVPRGEGGELLPVVIEDAAVLVEDGEARLALRDLDVELQPQAASSANIRVTGGGDLFGKLSLEGRVDVATRSFDLAGSVESIELSERLVSLLPPGLVASLPLPGGGEDWPRALRGRVNLAGTASGSLDRPGEIAAAFRGRLEAGRFEHPSIPFPLVDITAQFEADREVPPASDSRPGRPPRRSRAAGGSKPGAPMPISSSNSRLNGSISAATGSRCCRRCSPSSFASFSRPERSICEPISPAAVP